MSLSELRYARLITWKDGLIGRTFSTSSSQRDDIQAQGQSGSNQKSTGARSVVVSVDCVMGLSSGWIGTTAGPRGCSGAVVATGWSDWVIPRAGCEDAPIPGTNLTRD